MTLYIIGNGFDLSHNLNTSFNSFKKFMQKESNESIEKWQEIVSINLTENWSNLEESFEKVDYDYILETCSNYLNNYNENYNSLYKKDYKLELNKYLDLALKSDYYLRKWLKNLELPHTKKYNLDNNNLYLTFNYTNLLEKTYKINKSNICHIHGDLDYKERLILGHDNPQIIENNNKNTISKDTRIIALNKIVNDSKYKSYKNSNTLIKENKDFFIKCRAVENIYIIGHSCESISKVDSEYYKKIASIVNKETINIYVIYYRKTDIPKYQKALTSLGFKNIYYLTYDAIKI